MTLREPSGLMLNKVSTSGRRTTGLFRCTTGLLTGTSPSGTTSLMIAQRGRRLRYCSFLAFFSGTLPGTLVFLIDST